MQVRYRAALRPELCLRIKKKEGAAKVRLLTIFPESKTTFIFAA
jgi:hypothetical protein